MRMLLMVLRVQTDAKWMQMDAKFGQLKNESKSEIFRAPVDAQKSASGTTIKAFDMHLMIKFRVLLLIHLEVYLKIHFEIYMKIRKKLHLRLH